MVFQATTPLPNELTRFKLKDWLAVLGFISWTSHKDYLHIKRYKWFKCRDGLPKLITPSNYTVESTGSYEDEMLTVHWRLSIHSRATSKWFALISKWRNYLKQSRQNRNIAVGNVDVSSGYLVSTLDWILLWFKIIYPTPLVKRTS